MEFFGITLQRTLPSYHSCHWVVFLNKFSASLYNFWSNFLPSMVIWPVHIPWSEFQGNYTVPQIPVHQLVLVWEQSIQPHSSCWGLWLPAKSQNSPGRGMARVMLLLELMQHLSSKARRAFWMSFAVSDSVVVSHNYMVQQPLYTFIDWELLPLTSPAFLKKVNSSKMDSIVGLEPVCGNVMYLIQNTLL